MLQQLEEIKVINVDGTEYPVADQSEKVQGLVRLYDEWRREEYDLKKNVLKVEAALRDLSREIVGLIRSELAAAEKAATEAVEEAANDVPANDVAANDVPANDVAAADSAAE